MIKILAFLFSFLSFSFQSEEPVSWKYNLSKIDSNQYNLTLDAEIIEGWKLYSQYSPVEGTATEFVFLTPNLLDLYLLAFNMIVINSDNNGGSA